MKFQDLTEEQKAKIPAHVKKWFNVITSTVNIPFEEAKEIVRDFRILIDLNPDVECITAKNPIEAWVLCCLFDQGVPLEDLYSEMAKVFARQSKHSIPPAESPTGGTNGNYQPDLTSKYNYSIPTADLPYNLSTLSHIFSFYDFMFNEVGVEIDAELLKKYKVWERTSAIWGIYPLEGLTVICEKPTVYKTNEEGVIHCDGGPAIVFDGLGDFRIFALNGTRVPEYLAVTPSHQIDLEMYNKETNADVKGEFVRKVGIEQFLTMGKKLDTYENYDQEDHTWWWKSEYELWDMACMFPALEGVRGYLKMRNPTTQIWHLEAVKPGITTLQEAIADRFGGRNMRIVHAA